MYSKFSLLAKNIKIASCQAAIRTHARGQIAEKSACRSIQFPDDKYTPSALYTRHSCTKSLRIHPQEESKLSLRLPVEIVQPRLEQAYQVLTTRMLRSSSASRVLSAYSFSRYNSKASGSSQYQRISPK